MKKIIITILIAALLISGIVFFANKKAEDSLVKNNKSREETENAQNSEVVKKDDTNKTSNSNNVYILNGKQIIEIKAKGGYEPQKSVAQAGVPTILRFETSGTFDCSSFIRIPSMNLNKNLPRSGITDVDLGIQPAGIFRGSCGMGMYPFEIKFR